MENRIKNYEVFIESELLKFTRGRNNLLHRRTGEERMKLFHYHQHMVECFQHERFIHMIIMFFFIVLTVGVVVITGALMSTLLPCFWLSIWPLILLSVILIILTFCYIKHYYFLENHIQNLYDKSAKILDYTCNDRENIKRRLKK